MKFAEAKTHFASSVQEFKKAKDTAFDNKLQFLQTKARECEKNSKWNELKVWAEKIRPLNSSLANQFTNTANNELKKIAVEKKLASARSAKNENNWQSVYDHAVAALKIDNSNSEAQKLKQEAENNLCIEFFYAGKYAEAWQIIPQIRQKSADVELILGFFYDYGMNLCKIDSKTAFKYYQSAADRGNIIAKFEVALRLYGGVGCPRQPELAKELSNKIFHQLKRLAESGNHWAQNNFGVSYHGGLGVTEDYAEAVKWHRKAAEQGFAPAQLFLGVCYTQGHGVTQNHAEAVKWYRKAAEQGFAPAQSTLGLLYYTHGLGVTQDYAEAVKWYRKAAEQGLATAQNNLGHCYETGRGVTQNHAEAFKWYRKAAEQGQAEIQYTVGMCYTHGIGVTQDHTEAVKWYRKAAEQGLAMAQYNLGVSYDRGEGVSKNHTEAVKWYRKAAEQGHADAKKALKRLGY